MNYQSDNKERRMQAANMLGVYPEELSYYAWPQMYSSTTGPFPGFGGQAFSNFTIEAWFDGKNAVLYCSGKYYKTVVDFDPREAVTGRYK